MADKDPPPFGYHFNGSFFDGDATSYDNSGQSLLTDTETQSIADFFTNTDPFHLSDSQPYSLLDDTKLSAEDFSNWSNFITPATVHGVSTTIPDQTHLHNGFFNSHNYAQSSLPTDHMGNTHDDLQAASTLFNNSQFSYTDGRSQSLHGMPSSSHDTNIDGVSSSIRNGKPMVVTQHGLMNEQLAALIPNHSQQGTIDAQMAAQWAASNAAQLQEADFGLMRQPNLKRPYAFGTDDSFNDPSGYSGPYGKEATDQATGRLMRKMRHSLPLLRIGVDTNGAGISSIKHTQLSSPRPEEPSEDEQSEDASSDEVEDVKPAKKRKKSKHTKESAPKDARNGKNRKGSATDELAKKKRASAAQKLQRENLTEAQKRNNHILSEQKRRNLIKRGFEDLHDLVPEIRNGGLSKSSVLMEAANFLEKLIEDNNAFSQLVGD